MSVTRMISCRSYMKASSKVASKISTRFASTYKTSVSDLLSTDISNVSLLGYPTRKISRRGGISFTDPSFQEQCDILASPLNLQLKSKLFNDDKNTEKDPTNDKSQNENGNEEKPTTIPEDSDVIRNDIKNEIDSISKSNLSGSDTEGVASSSAAAAAPPSSGDGGNGESNNDRPPDISKESRKKLNIGDSKYQSLIAIPLDRPLVPNFFKAITISDPEVIKAVNKSIDERVPYIVCFYMKNMEPDTDVIHSADSIDKVGVLVQITNSFSASKTTGKPEALSLSVYPHCAVNLDRLYPPSRGKPAEVIENTTEAPKEASETTTTTTTTTTVAKPEKSEPVDKRETGGVHNFLDEFKVTLADTSSFVLNEYDINSPKVAALTSQALETCRELATLNDSFKKAALSYSKLHPKMFETPILLVYLALATGYTQPAEMQQVLASPDIETKLLGAITSLKQDVVRAQFQLKLHAEISARADKRHRDFDLMENLKVIKKELGIDDGKAIIETFTNRANALDMPAAARTVFDDEIKRLGSLEPNSSEFSVIKNYLEWITLLPWNKFTEDTFDLNKAIEVLNRDHYGMKETKERILEFIAVGKLMGKADGRIICFVGPPGVGKTSIAKSIAESLNRKFVRFSVGGINDVSEVKGHRRTYVGALPGRIIAALKQTQSSNPLLLVDEIDKIPQRGSHGDPGAALLEVLDPEQNNAFLDQFLDIPVDLSKVLFVCTANTLSTIPGPLLDRMEIIEISGYVEDEKIQIAEKYLCPEAKKKAGLENVDVTIDPSAIVALIKNYCRESGVRNLSKQISKIYRKAAHTIVKDLTGETKDVVFEKKLEDTPVEEDFAKTTDTQAKSEIEAKKPEEKPLEKLVVPESYKVEINADNLHKYIGPPVFTRDRLYETTPPGVVMGLAWTSMGGATLYIESIFEQPLAAESTPKLETTGQLGDVMKESTLIAFNYAKMLLGKTYPENRFFNKAKIHLHCPEGATPKDGPSAGVTMATSLISLALNKPLSPTIAMTGELTLTGKVLKIGGLKEKCIAAKRSGCDTVIFPKDNMVDWEELSDNIKEGLTVHGVDWYPEILKIVFPDLTEKEANNVWKKEFDRFKDVPDTKSPEIRI